MKQVLKIFLASALISSFSFARTQVSENIKELLSTMPIEKFVKILRNNEGKKLNPFLEIGKVTYNRLTKTIIIKRKLLPPFLNSPVLKALSKHNKLPSDEMGKAKIFATVLLYSTRWDICESNSGGSQALTYYVNKGYKFEYDTTYNGKVLTKNLITKHTCEKVDKYNSLEEYLKDNL